MSLVSFKALLKDAQRRGYAVGSFNMLSIETVRGAVKAAEELNSPIILQLAEVHTPAAPAEYMAPVMLEAAKRAKVPVAVHFDHGTSFESIAEAIKYGFTSVMFDGASNSYEDNLRLTREVAKMAHALGVDIEAELGQVGGTEDGHGDHAGSLTDIREAAAFVKGTGVDALAISIGNLHGEYKVPPKLDFDRLKAISNSISTPLVLHGGSGISEMDFKKCIRNGICKINIGTAVQLGASRVVKATVDKALKKPSYFSIMDSIIQGTKEAVKEHIYIFGSESKAAYSREEEVVSEVVKKILSHINMKQGV